MTQTVASEKLPLKEDAADKSEYDAILVVGFGGPEKREDVLPFLENVTRGRNIPRERLLEVAGALSSPGRGEPDQRSGSRVDRGPAGRTAPAWDHRAGLLG